MLLCYRVRSIRNALEAGHQGRIDGIAVVLNRSARAMIASVFVLATAIAACAPSERSFLLASAGDRPSPREMSGYVEGSSSIGNYLAGRHAQTQSDYASAADYLSRALQGDPKTAS